MKKETKKKLKRFGILGGIFFAALIVYFVWSFNSMEKSNTIYAALDEPKLPVAYVEVNGRKMNPMHAYVQDMGNRAARDSITVLPSDRQLKLLIDEYSSMVVSVQYEIRSLDLTHLIENGSISDITREGSSAQLTLPIQNLIQKDKEYLLTLTMDTGEQQLHYYTRILWTDQSYVEDMLELAYSFTTKTFDYNAARDLTTYLETNDAADNSNLGHVDIQSNFSQLTWRETGMQPVGDFQLILKECTGVMSEVQIRYQTMRVLEDGSQEYYQNEDNYILRYDPQRIFIMDFDRVTNEIFQAAADDFSGSRILLGVTNTEALQTKTSDSGRFVAFKTTQGIWRYDQDQREGYTCVNVFSYQSEIEDGIKENYPAHDMKILSCKNNGDVDFLVYGYINRGRHEGYNGIVYYTYDNSEDTIVENFFIPIADTYEKIAYNASRLSYISDRDMLQLFQNGSIYSIDINSLEVITLASGLEEGEFATSDQGDRIAWQQEDEAGQQVITLLDLTQDRSSVISEDGAYVRVLGFIGEDLVYGICDLADVENAVDVREVPMRELRIMGSDRQEQNRYQKEGVYISNVRVEGNRIRLDLMSRGEDGNFIKLGTDTIVANREILDERLNGIGYYASSDKGRVYFIEINDIGSSTVSTRTPRTISYENTSSLELSQPQSDGGEVNTFDAYALGHYVGSRATLGEAVDLVYDDQGYVIDSEHNILWNRTDRENIITNRNPIEDASVITGHLGELRPYHRYDNIVVMDARGLQLSAVLYYVGKGIPVVAYHTDGSYDLISAYDQFNVRLVNPADSSSELMGRNDAEAYFDSQGNVFAVAVAVE